jgi:hypothetical protein
VIIKAKFLLSHSTFFLLSEPHTPVVLLDIDCDKLTSLSSLNIATLTTDVVCAHYLLFHIHRMDKAEDVSRGRGEHF